MNILNQLKTKLSRTRENLIIKIKEALAGKSFFDQSTRDRLEEILISSDIGYDLTARILENVRRELVNVPEKIHDSAILELIKNELKNTLNSNLEQSREIKDSLKDKPSPYIILVLGVNGVGKTTTIGKLAFNYQQQGKKVLIAASDTFRAAASDQLQIWSERANVKIVTNEKSIDPGAVTYQAIEKAVKENYDILLIDTAGRLHTKKHLMDELSKLNRIINKKLNRDPDEVLLVIDASTGQNAVYQADEFSKAAKLTGLVVTKLDGTAKGGIIFQIIQKQKIPIRFIGVGENLNDLKPFNTDEFISAILDEA